jgi:hypothetical protein
MLLVGFQLSGDSLSHEKEKINESLISEHVTYFDIHDLRFENAEPLTQVLDSAHFVALGELHNRTRLGELTQAMLLYFEPLGYNSFALETGPYSADKLKKLIQIGEQSVTGFYDSYSSNLFDIYPIPFFTGETDLGVLKTADSLEYDFWGIDQEFAFSYSYLIDELISLSGEKVTAKQVSLGEELNSKLFWWNRRSVVFSSFNMNCLLKEDPDLNRYLNSFEKSSDAEIHRIIKAFRATLEIYCMAEQGKGSSRVRINYFKHNFDENYRSALKNKDEVKVFLKIGSFHAGRHKSPLGIYDIGNFIHNLADSLSQQSVHIRYLNRFYKGEDMYGREGWESSGNFISFGRKDKWTLIDLRPLRSAIEDGRVEGSPFEEREIRNYDFIVVPPEDKFVSTHY